MPTLPHFPQKTDTLYPLYEARRAALEPVAALAERGAKLFGARPLVKLPFARHVAASYDLWHRITKTYEDPGFHLDETFLAGAGAVAAAAEGVASGAVDGAAARGRDVRAPDGASGIARAGAGPAPVAVEERVVWEKPFCRLVHFRRALPEGHVRARDPRVLLVAPLSGHHASLLRDTVRALLPAHEVYVTDWVDARLVPLSRGGFSLDDYVAYVHGMIRELGPDVHVLAVCQPTVPVLAAVARMATEGDPSRPRSMILMGGPIDARKSPTEVNALATKKPYAWFEENVICTVPERYPGYLRRVYPGFLQLSGFVAMNPGKHWRAHVGYYRDVAGGRTGDAEMHRRFYDDYNAVLDMAAEYYLDTVRVVFQEHLLPRGAWKVAGELVRPGDIRDVALLTVEGELDDIAGLGQTRAAHDLCTAIPEAHKQHVTAEGVGHYGVFAGRRFRERIYPAIHDFIRAHERPGTRAAEGEHGATPGDAPRAMHEGDDR